MDIIVKLDAKEISSYATQSKENGKLFSGSAGWLALFKRHEKC